MQILHYTLQVLFVSVWCQYVHEEYLTWGFNRTWVAIFKPATISLTTCRCCLSKYGKQNVHQWVEPQTVLLALCNQLALECRRQFHLLLSKFECTTLLCYTTVWYSSLDTDMPGQYRVVVWITCSWSCTSLSSPCTEMVEWHIGCLC